MKHTSVAVVLVLVFGALSTSFASDSLAKVLHRLRCKNGWDCKTCAEVKRKGRCNFGYLKGVCYKTCTGCDPYMDKPGPGYDCASIKKQGKCFSKMKSNPYVTYAARCEASCCSAYPLPVPSTKPPVLLTPAPKVVWNQWSSWGPCSKTCHKGFKKRIRTCYILRGYATVNCTRPQRQFRYCNQYVTCRARAYPLSTRSTKLPSSSTTAPTVSSPIKVIWSQWSSWGPCSKTCYRGYQKRIRTCSFSRGNAIVNCTRPQKQFRYCNQYVTCREEDFKSCSLRRQAPLAATQLTIMIDGGFSEWSQWSACSVTCGVKGAQYRSRTCTNPPPQDGGRDCNGSRSETKECHARCCPEAGEWSQWSSWSSCSKSCSSSKDDYGTRRRTRMCTNPPPYCGGLSCDGPSSQNKPCLPTVPCEYPTKPSLPYWSSWGSWGPCSATCYVGYRERKRECKGYTGYNEYCQGMSTNYESCNTNTLC